MREGDRTAKPSRREKRLRAANKFYKQLGFDLAEARGRDPEDPDAPLFSKLRGLTGRIPGKDKRKGGK